MADRLQTRASVRSAVVWRSVREILAELSTQTGRDHLDVLDAGGGTGGFSVPLAELGHRVTVVDASPDSLAALERRAADSGVSDRVRSFQGDAANLLEVVGAASFDLVVLHSVLEVVDDPAATLAGVGRTLRTGGVVSVLAANRLATVLHRAIAGRFDEALEALEARDEARSLGLPDLLRPRRFTLSELEALLTGANFSVLAAHGSRVFADLVQGASLDADPNAVETLIALEMATCELPAFRDIATQLHVIGRRRE
jgi:S-adenosylmethionine-dependent methyltransferase